MKSPPTPSVVPEPVSANTPSALLACGSQLVRAPVVSSTASSLWRVIDGGARVLAALHAAVVVVVAADVDHAVERRDRLDVAVGAALPHRRARRQVEVGEVAAAAGARDEDAARVDRHVDDGIREAVRERGDWRARRRVERGDVAVARAVDRREVAGNVDAAPVSGHVDGLHEVVGGREPTSC